MSNNEWRTEHTVWENKKVKKYKTKTKTTKLINMEKNINKIIIIWKQSKYQWVK